MYTSNVFINQTNCLWKEYELILPTRTPTKCMSLSECMSVSDPVFFLKRRCSN